MQGKGSVDTRNLVILQGGALLAMTEDGLSLEEANKQIERSLDRGDALEKFRSGRPAEFSHSLESQLGGQLAAGFGLTALYEDHWDDEATPLNRYSPMAIATRSVAGMAEGSR